MRWVLIVFGFALVSIHRGDALFNGKEALRGRIRGHDQVLPPQAVRCVNCHGASSARLSGNAAPHLDSSFLLDFRQRRGGPPTSYDRPAFCRMLRTGADPAQILIAREMPTYELDDAQCASLWTFLAGKDQVRTENNRKQ